MLSKVTTGYYYTAKLLNGESFFEYVKHQLESFYTELEQKSQLLEIFFQKLTQLLVLQKVTANENSFQKYVVIMESKKVTFAL